MDIAGLLKVHPTALKRHRRRDESSSTIIPEIEGAPQIEEGKGDKKGGRIDSAISR